MAPRVLPGQSQAQAGGAVTLLLLALPLALILGAVLIEAIIAAVWGEP